MKCPQCQTDSRVMRTRYAPEVNGMLRRRECLNDRCEHRWNTIEIVDVAASEIAERRNISRELSDA